MYVPTLAMRRVLAAVLFLCAMTLGAFVLLSLLAPFVADAIAGGGTDVLVPWVLGLVLAGPAFLALGRVAANWFRDAPKIPVWHPPSLRALAAMYGTAAALAFALSIGSTHFGAAIGLAVATLAVVTASFVGPR